MIKEYKQLNELAVFGAVHPNAIDDGEKRKALKAINLIKEKRCSKIKVRTVTDGSQQRKYVSRDETISLTISLLALFATFIIDVQEGRKVQTFDISGAYLHAEIPKEEKVYMKFEGDFADIICEVKHEYRKFVTIEIDRRVLNIRVLMAIYGMIESALRWYDLFSSTLTGMGFDINPYDKCTANKILNGSQCTVGWCVDDNKVSHVDDDVIDMLVDEIEAKFGKLARNKGIKHTFLGMDIEILPDKKIIISTPQHIEEVVSDLREEIKGGVAIPAKSKHFYVNTKSCKLSEKKAELFHKLVAKLLWITQRSRTDLETGVSFLCTRVQESTEEDWTQFVRVISFLKSTRTDRRIMRADSLNSLDASYAVHTNMRVHTGGVMTLG